MLEGFIIRTYNDNSPIYISEEENYATAIEEAIHRNVKLIDASFVEMDLQEVVFVGGHLAGGDFTGSNLCGANLANTNLYNANFNNTILDYTDFTCANLTSCEFSNVDLTYTRFDTAYMYNCKFDNVIINWYSRELISEVLRKKAGDDIDKLQYSGLFLTMPPAMDIWKLELPQRKWALEVLEGYKESLPDNLKFLYE